MESICDRTAVDLMQLLKSRALSPVELLDACLARIAALNPAINAVVTLDEEGARRAAKAAEAALLKGEDLGPLHGLPVLIKDTQDTAGLRTTYGSPILADNVPSADQASVARLRAAGAIIFGKTNTPEWAAGANTRNPVFGATGNPFDPMRSAAGSSGGSAAALACDMAPLASGSDTGGSLRNPAAFCGIVGMRPSYGLVASDKRAHGWSNLSTDGPMARNVADTALMLSVMASDDPRDPLAYTLPNEPVRGVPARWSPPAPVALGKLRLAFTEDFGFAPTEKSVRRVLRARVARIAPLFASCEEGTPDCSGADEAFAVLRAGMFLTNHGKNFRERPEMVGPNVRANVEEGLRYSLDDYAKAAAAQTRIYRAYQSFFERCDVLVSPAITLSPRPWSELYPTHIDGVPTRSYFHWLALAYAVTLPGHPALSLPLGVDEAGLPFGLQIVGPRGGDALVLSVAAALESAFAGDAELCRPVPDLAKLAAAPPLSSAPGFRSWD
ncbi:putative amidase [Bradyrhizobium sp. STM 3843]|uniref:amidase n=1 Tax=Bradyrhizobium sp. STM 3843 TaxID=551947 RepID=UPI000240AA85|nr:amidase family protein [Bradyrhizobium sp. STM 3843]CCE05442.1 putative amidase [Bradyrhizobium sp. STM 3843]